MARPYVMPSKRPEPARAVRTASVREVVAGRLRRKRPLTPAQRRRLERDRAAWRVIAWPLFIAGAPIPAPPGAVVRWREWAVRALRFCAACELHPDRPDLAEIVATPLPPRAVWPLLRGLTAHQRIRLRAVADGRRVPDTLPPS